MDQEMVEYFEDFRSLRPLFAQLTALQSERLSFESRFHVLYLQFPIEHLLNGHFVAPTGQQYIYCVFVNREGLRHCTLNEHEVLLALKIKAQIPLNLDEKSRALDLLRRLSL